MRCHTHFEDPSLYASDDVSIASTSEFCTDSADIIDRKILSVQVGITSGRIVFIPSLKGTVSVVSVAVSGSCTRVL
jgi:hypothetical protein